MKPNLCILILVMMLSGNATLEAQWERIGWQGGMVWPEAQLGNTLFGLSVPTFYRSTDWGTSWSIFTKGLPVTSLFTGPLHTFPKQDLLLIDAADAFHYSPNAFEFGIYYSHENDTAWSFKKLSLTHGESAHVLFFSGDSVFAYRGGGDPNADSLDGYYFSSNGGSSWERRMHSESVVLSVNRYSIAYRIGSHFFLDPFNALFVTKDFGLSWKKMDIPTGDSLWHTVYALSDSVLILDASSNTSRYLYRSTDLGTSWTNISSSFPFVNTSTHISNFKTVGSKIFLTTGITYLDSRVFVSPDLCQTWNRILYQDTDLWYFDIFGTDTNAVGPVTKYNNGATYTELFTMDTGMSALRNLVPAGTMSNTRKLVGVSGTKLFALTDANPDQTALYDSLLISDDNGTTWRQRIFSPENKLDNNRWFADGNDLYTSGVNKDLLPCIFRSTDQGNLWNTAAILPASSSGQIDRFFVEGDTVVAVQGGNLLASIDAGYTWVISPVRLNLPSAYFYKHGVFLDPFIQMYSGNPFFEISLNLGIKEQVRIANSYQENAYGSYIFGNRLFGVFGANLDIYTVYFHANSDSAWRKAKGLSTSLLCIPSCDDNGILYATGTGINGNISFEGRTALYYSRDSGANWKQLGDYVTNAADVFIGSDYVFLVGPNELWRGPKPAITSAVTPSHGISAIAINECYPNPAATNMRIGYATPAKSTVTLSLFDMTGKEILPIFSGKQDAGAYEMTCDLRSLSSGSYMLKLSACGESVTKIVEVIK